MEVMATEITCAYCGEKSLKRTAEINRIKRSGRTVFYCNNQCASKDIQGKKFPRVKKACPTCGSEFESSNAKQALKFCSQKCANVNAGKKGVEKAVAEGRWTKLSKEEKRAKMKIQRLGWKKSDLVCEICNRGFQNFNRKAKTCSKDCFRKHTSQRAAANPNCGGQSNYKRYTYNGITMDSSWEVEVAKFMDEKGIRWERSKKLCVIWTDDDGRKRRYHPDFYLPDYDMYIEPKNKFLLIRDFQKLERAKAENGINLVYGLKEYILEELSKLK